MNCSATASIWLCYYCISWLLLPTAPALQIGVCRVKCCYSVRISKRCFPSSPTLYSLVKTLIGSFLALWKWQTKKPKLFHITLFLFLRLTYVNFDWLCWALLMLVVKFGPWPEKTTRRIKLQGCCFSSAPFSWLAKTSENLSCNHIFQRQFPATSHSEVHCVSVSVFQLQHSTFKFHLW